MNVLVLSPCSKDKYYDESVLDCEALDKYSRETLVQEHSEFVKPAAEMYTGAEHEHIKTAVNRLREIATVDWHIISAGFGLLREDTEIPKYDCGFSRDNIESVRARAERAGYDVDDLTNDETIQAVGREKGIPRDFSQVLNQGYDILFVVLSEPYLLSVAEALTGIPKQTTAFAFASKGSKQYIGDCHWLPATKTELQALETTWMRLRGKLFQTFAAEVTEKELEEIVEHPHQLENSIP